MLRLPLLLLTVAVALASAGSARATAAGFGAAGLGDQVAAAPARATAAELKAAQAAVDAALKARKAKLDAWQRSQKLRDAAAADVAKKKKSGAAGLDDALKGALSLDEDAAHARSQLLAAESDVATKGAALLKLYDSLLVDRRRAVEGLPAQSQARAQAVSSYRDLAAQRDAVRQALLPVLGSVDVELPRGVDLEARPEDDVETLLEKADLARDLEERFLRQAEAVHRRISELEDEQAVAKDVSGMVGRSQLFDEEDRRLFVIHSESQSSATANNGLRDSSRTSNNAPPPSAPAAGGVGAGNGDFGSTAGDPLSEHSPSTAVSLPASPVAFSASPTSQVRTEQVNVPQTDPAIAGLLSSSNVSVESLKALEAKLKAQADDLKGKSKKLKSQAQTLR